MSAAVRSIGEFFEANKAQAHRCVSVTRKHPVEAGADIWLGGEAEFQRPFKAPEKGYMMLRFGRSGNDAYTFSTVPELEGKIVDMTNAPSVVAKDSLHSQVVVEAYSVANGYQYYDKKRPGMKSHTSHYAFHSSFRVAAARDPLAGEPLNYQLIATPGTEPTDVLLLGWNVTLNVPFNNFEGKTVVHASDLSAGNIIHTDASAPEGYVVSSAEYARFGLRRFG